MTAPVFCVVEAAAVCAFSVCATLGARRCGIRLHLHERTPALLLLAGISAGGAVFVTHPFLADAATFAIVAAAVAVCAATDAANGFVFDAVTLPALGLLLPASWLYGHFAPSILGALCAAGAILAIYAATQGRGIGLGDAKLAACIGAGLGVRGSLYALGIAFVAGALAGIACLMLQRMQRGSEMRFAPYLAAGTIAAVAWQAA